MQAVSLQEKLINARPFLKWAGGKTQLLGDLEARLPEKIKQTKTIEKYIEPFLGGGAVFFHLKKNYHIKESYLSDINQEIVIGYKVIQKDYNDLISVLSKLEKQYHDKSEENRETLYYEIRDKYNKQIHNFDYSKYNKSWIERASLLIFLNRTCFNGLFRQNKKGEFNVPFGRYKNPTICDKNNIEEVYYALQDTEILCTDFEKLSKYIDKESLIYLDPPYRPLNPTSSFTDYSKEGFTDKDQERLASFFQVMDKKGAYLILSNSDPKNDNPDDNFFDNLYRNYNIDRVDANRMINCNGEKRGKIKELIITNQR